MDSLRCCIALRSGFATPVWLSSCVHRLDRAEHHLSPHMGSCSVWEPPSKDRTVAVNEPTRHFELKKVPFLSPRGKEREQLRQLHSPCASLRTAFGSARAPPCGTSESASLAGHAMCVVSRLLISRSFQGEFAMSFALCVALRIIHFKPATALRPIAREASGEHAQAAAVNAEGDEKAQQERFPCTAGPHHCRRTRALLPHSLEGDVR